MERLLARPDAARGLHPDLDARCEPMVADRLEHAERHGRRGRGQDLARRGLDEVGSGRDREVGRAADVVVRLELARLENDLQLGLTARFLDRRDLVEDLAEVAREERAAVDHHVDLVRASRHRALDVRDLHGQRRAARRKRRRNARDFHGRARERPPRDRDEVRVDANGRDGRDRKVGRVRPEGLRAHLPDLAR